MSTRKQGVVYVHVTYTRGRSVLWYIQWDANTGHSSKCSMERLRRSSLSFTRLLNTTWVVHFIGVKKSQNFIGIEMGFGRGCITAFLSPPCITNFPKGVVTFYPQNCLFCCLKKNEVGLTLCTFCVLYVLCVLYVYPVYFMCTLCTRWVLCASHVLFE